MKGSREVIEKYCEENGMKSKGRGFNDVIADVVAQLIIDTQGLKKRKEKKVAKGSKVWDAFKTEYLFIYKTEPVRNALSNKLCCSLVDRLGEADAIETVQFYLNQRDAFYTKNAHHLRFCVQDCETLLVKWKSGLKITTKSAKKVETASHNANVTRDYLKEKHGK